MSYYYLEIVRGIERGKRYELTEGAIPIGRSPRSALPIHKGEKAVSTHHAILYVHPDNHVIQDFQSTNGILLNDTHVEGQCTVTHGDIIALGKTGPRLRFLIAETKLASQAQRPVEHCHATDTLAPAATNGDAASPPSSNAPVLPHPPSCTEELERKLHDERLSVTDMHHLLRNGNRLDRLLQRPTLNSIHRNLLTSMQGAQRRLSRSWTVTGGVILSAAIVSIAYFGIQSARYRARLEKAHLLKKQLDTYEHTLANAQQTPHADSTALRHLREQIAQKARTYVSLRETLDSDDFRRSYKDPLERTLDAVLARFGETNYYIPPLMLERVRHHIEIYAGRMKPTIARYLNRKATYFPMIHRIFKQKNLPGELAYLAMLESGLNPRALSSAGARGLWQFMPTTARAYHLRVQDAVDDRLDPEKATVAAATYINNLIGIFGGKSSVMLAMAAYNAGEGRIIGALRKIENPLQDRDFWYLYRKGFLAEETNEYIPRVLALIIIDQNRAAYGFADGYLSDTLSTSSRPSTKSADSSPAAPKPRPHPPAKKKSNAP